MATSTPLIVALVVVLALLLAADVEAFAPLLKGKWVWEWLVSLLFGFEARPRARRRGWGVHQPINKSIDQRDQRQTNQPIDQSTNADHTTRLT